MKIDDYTSKSLEVVFDKHIDKLANIETDKWKGCRPLQYRYKINQKLSIGGRNMPQIHIVIH